MAKAAQDTDFVPPLVQLFEVWALSVGPQQIGVFRLCHVGVAVVGAACHLAGELVGVRVVVPGGRRVKITAQALHQPGVLCDGVLEMLVQSGLVRENRIPRHRGVLAFPQFSVASAPVTGGCAGSQTLLS